MSGPLTTRVLGEGIVAELPARASLFRLNTSWAFAGNLLYAVCQWTILVMIAKTLPLADVGVFALALAVTAPVFVLANLRLRGLLATDVVSAGGTPDYVAARLATTCLGFIVSLCLGALFSSQPGIFVVVLLVALARSFDAMSEICHGIFQRDLDMRSSSVGLVINGLASLLLVALSLSAGGSLIAATVCYATGSVSAFLLWDAPLAQRAVRRTEQASLWQRPSTALALRAIALLRRAAPLGVSTALGTAQASVSRFAVALILGPQALGIFAALSYLTLPGSVVINAVGQAALPTLARDLRSSTGAYRRRLAFLVTIGITVALASLLTVAFWGEWLLNLVYSTEYAANSSLLLALTAASGLTYAFIFMGTAATVRGRYWAQCGISAASLTVALAVVYPLTTTFGLMGAAYTVCIGAGVECVSYVVLTAVDWSRPAPEVSPAWK